MKISLSFLFFLISISLMNCAANHHPNFNLRITKKDSILYFSDTITLSGTIYTYVDKRSTDYNPLTSLFFVAKDSLIDKEANNSIISTKNFYYFLKEKDYLSIKKIKQESFSLSRNFQKDLAKNANQAKDYNINHGDKILSCKYKGTFLLFFIDVSYYKAFFWVNKKMKQLPKDGYVKCIVPVSYFKDVVK